MQLKADSHIACRAHAAPMPFPCNAVQLRVYSVSFLFDSHPPTMLPAGGRQHCGCVIPQTVTHSLVLLKMGKIFSQNMLS